MKNKKVYLSIVALLLIVFCIACTSFALFTYSRLGQTKTTIVSGDIEFSFIDKADVTIENAFPLSDSIGAVDDNYKYEFDVKLSSSSNKVSALYNVTLVSNNTGENNFKNNEIKFNLYKNGQFVDFDNDVTGELGYLLSSIDGFNDNQTNGSGVVLANQSISSNDTDKYVLRIWISDDVNYSGDIDSNGTMVGTKNSYTYSLKVKIDAIASQSGSSAKFDANEVKVELGNNSECNTLNCALNELYNML